MASNKNQKPKAKAKEEKQEVNKLELAKEVLLAKKEKEATKQKGIYSLMGSFEIVRK